MDTEDLASMGIDAPGHRQRMLASIAYLRNHPGHKAKGPGPSHVNSQTPSVSTTLVVSPSPSPADMDPASAAPPLDAVSEEAPLSPLNPAAVADAVAEGQEAAQEAAAGEREAAGEASQDATSAFDEPNEDELIPEGRVHSASALNSGAVQYTAQYLGSRVSSVHGSAKATIKAVAKMRSSGKLILNKPPISLNLTTGAIRFLDPTSQTVIVSHDMASVKFPAQDTKDPSMLAYLTSQAKPDGSIRHLCHVFRVETELLAGDIVTTMQQAQEVSDAGGGRLVNKNGRRGRGL